MKTREEKVEYLKKVSQPDDGKWKTNIEKHLVKGVTHDTEEKVNPEELKTSLFNEDYYRRSCEWMDSNNLFWNPLTEQMEEISANEEIIENIAKTEDFD